MAAFILTEDGIAMATIANSNEPAEVAVFHHAASFSPALSTLQEAMKKGYLPPLFGFTVHTLEKYPPPQEARGIIGESTSNQRKRISTKTAETTPKMHFQPNQPIRTENTRVTTT